MFLRGVFYTCVASLFWGMPQPLFFNQINYVPPIEIAMHRAVWSFVILFITLIIFENLNEFYLIFRSIKKMLILTITAMLITINWTGFIYAVSIGSVQDASMGYFLTPMVSIGLGYFFLKEKLSISKIISLILMIFSLFFLIINSKSLPFISLIIGTSWALYGLLRKKIDISPAAGLLYESGLITFITLPYLFYLYINMNGFFIIHNNTTTILLLLTGVITVFPLFLFNLGMKKIPLGLAGVLFYIAPTFHFITSIFILEENIKIEKIISFIFIWIAVSIFIVDILRDKKKTSVNNTQLLN